MQCYKISKNDIDKRLDADYYQPEFIQNISRIKNSKFCLVTLEQISEKIVNGLDDRNFKENGKIPYLRVGNIKPDRFDLIDAKYIDETDFNKDIKLESGDLLLTRKGSYGIALVVDKEHTNCIICSEIFRIVLKKENINPYYVSYWLNSSVAQKYIKRISTGAIMGHISQEVLKEIIIPLPEINTQNEIVKIMYGAYKNRYQKEQEAENLLNSIDDFVLEQLGIELPEIENKMCYKIDSNELKNNRHDSFYYQPKFEKVIEFINESKYKSVTLKNTFNGAGLIKGYLPSENEKDGEAKVLQIKNITQEGYIKIENYQTAKAEVFGEHHLIKYKEILIVVTGATIGKVGLWNIHDKFYLGGDIVKFETNQDFSPEFVQAYLLSPLGQKQIQRNITGATNGHLSPNDIANIRIPLVPKSLQDDIANEIKKRKLLASNLRYEAREELEQAKAKVERTILGEEEIN